MPTEFTLPELGENVAAGDVVRVLVSPGDTIAKDQPVLELETDKATIEVPSSVAGTVKEIKVNAGDKVKVGQTILTLEDSDLLGEVELTTTLLIAASESDDHLSADEIDQILGVVPAPRSEA